MCVAALRPRARLTARRQRKHGPLFARHANGVLGCQIHEHCRERRVVLHVVPTDLVVGVAVGVPGVTAVIPIARAEAESRRAAGDERRVIGPAARGRAGEAELDVAGDVGGHAGEIARETRARIGEPRRAHVFDAAGAVVLIEQRLQSARDVGMIVHVAA